MKNLRVGLATVGAVTLLMAMAGCGSSGSTSPTASAGSGSASCTPAHKFDTITPGVLTVAVVPVPPIVDMSGKTMSGIDGEIITEIAKMECLELNPQNISGAGIIPSVQSKRTDIATGGWYRTAERSKIVGLTNPVYLDQMGLLTKNGADTFDALKGLKVGTPQGNMWVEDAQKVLGDSLKIYQSFDDVFADIRSGRLDAAIVGYGQASYIMKSNPIPGFQLTVPKADPAVAASLKPGQVGYPHTFGNQAMTDALNADIAKLAESGFIKKVLVANGYPESAADVGEPYLL